MKKHVETFDYAGTICKEMKKGILLTTQVDDKVNTMTIGWGKIGIEWGKPIFIAYVRESRYTKTMLEQSGEFTVNIPMGEVDKKILGYCGTKSGRDTDKIADLGLTLEEGEFITVPGIKELPLTLECRVLYKQQQIPECMCDPEPHTHYPAHSDNIHDDYHTAYYGEIVSAYYIENTH